MKRKKIYVLFSLLIILISGCSSQKALSHDNRNSHDNQNINYILNTKSHRFHYPDCPYVKQMKEKNKWIFYGSRNDAIYRGYAPCQKCNP